MDNIFFYAETADLFRCVTLDRHHFDLVIKHLYRWVPTIYEKKPDAGIGPVHQRITWMFQPTHNALELPHVRKYRQAVQMITDIGNILVKEDTIPDLPGIARAYPRIRFLRWKQEADGNLYTLLRDSPDRWKDLSLAVPDIERWAYEVGGLDYLERLQAEAGIPVISNLEVMDKPLHDYDDDDSAASLGTDVALFALEDFVGLLQVHIKTLKTLHIERNFFDDYYPSTHTLKKLLVPSLVELQLDWREPEDIQFALECDLPNLTELTFSLSIGETWSFTPRTKSGPRTASNSLPPCLKHAVLYICVDADSPVFPPSSVDLVSWLCETLPVDCKLDVIGDPMSMDLDDEDPRAWVHRWTDDVEHWYAHLRQCQGTM